MAEEKRLVIPADMGKTIVFGTTEKDKWNVKHDNTLLTKTDGSLSVVPPGCHRITNLNTMEGLPSGDGTFCIYGVHNNKNRIPGIMEDSTSTSETQPRWKAGETAANYDWNGWVIRSEGQLTVYVNEGSATWTSVNDNPGFPATTWSDWRRVENVVPPKTNDTVQTSGDRSNWAVDFGNGFKQVGGIVTISFTNTTESTITKSLPFTKLLDVQVTPIDVQGFLGETAHIQILGNNQIRIYARTSQNYTGDFLVKWSASGVV